MKKLIRSLLVSLPLLGAAMSATAQTQPTAKLVPSYLYPVETSIPNRKVYVCGQRPIDLQGQVVGRGDLNAQLALIFKNLTQSLSNIGMGPGNIRQISYRVIDSGLKSNGDNSQIINTAAAQYFGQNKANLPSISEIKNVPVQVDKDVVIEVEVVAIKE